MTDAVAHTVSEFAFDLFGLFGHDSVWM